MATLELSVDTTLGLSVPATQQPLLQLDISTSLNLASRPFGSRRRIIAVDMNGVPAGELTDEVVFGDITWELGAIDTYSFSVQSSHPSAALVSEYQEWQLWRGRWCMTWGPQTQPRLSGPAGFIGVTGHDPRYYLDRRFIGKADRTNHIQNGNFEDGLAHWAVPTYSVIEPAANLTYDNFLAEVVTTRAVSGSRSLHMAWADENDPDFGFAAHQFFIWSVDPATNPEGDKWTLAARVWIPDETFVAGPNESIGLVLLRASTVETIDITRPGGAVVTYPKTIEKGYATIDEDTPRNQWVTLVVPLEEPVTGVPEIVIVELWTPLGEIYWDRVVLAREETTSFYDTDVALIAQGLAIHLQDVAFDKSDVKITYDCPPIGVIKTRVYIHHEHPPGWRSMTELEELDDGVDIGMRFTKDSRVMFTRAKGAGTHHEALAIETRDLQSWDRTWEGEAGANAVLIYGDGTGSVREEGFAVDLTVFDGVVLERIEIAPLETPIDSLDPRARDILNNSKRPIMLEVKTVPDSRFVGRLLVGDDIHVHIVDGATTVASERMLIVRMTLHPDDSLSLVLNVVQV